MDSKKPGDCPRLRVCLLLGLMAASSGCYHTHLIASGESLTSSMNRLSRRTERFTRSAACALERFRSGPAPKLSA